MSPKTTKSAKANEVNLEALQKILQSNNKKQCIEFFKGMSEAQRRACFPVVKAFWTEVRKARVIENPPGTFAWNPLVGIATIAFFATASGSEVLKAKRSGYPDDEYAFEILADRRPDWTQQWMESLLGESYFWHNWRLMRRLIEAGLATKPDTPRYYLAMISGINRRMADVNLVEELERVPDLLQHDVWKLFEYDGDGENSLANTERTDRSWIAAFLKLIEKGKLPRAKMLESTVEALERDFNHYRARWFLDFFDRLEPTEKELRQYSQRILGLLGASAPNVASWALGRVESIASSGSFETATLCHAMEPMLRARAKTNVITALKLLQSHATAHSKSSGAVATTVALALAHESPDVQKATLKVLEAISSPDDAQVRDTVERLKPSVAASVRSLVNKWLDSGSSPTSTAKASTNSKSPPTGAQAPKSRKSVTESPKLSSQTKKLYAIDVLEKNVKEGLAAIPAAIFDGTDISRLKRCQPIAPIENIEELIDVCARVIEDGSLVDDAERCLDGLSRMADKKPDNFAQLTAPLLKRVRKLIQKGCSPFCGIDPANDLLGVFYSFVTGKVIEPKMKAGELVFEFEGEKHKQFPINRKKAIAILSDHCQAIAQRIATGASCQLLSAPTHTGGWIDPVVLAKRVNAWTGEAPDARDIVLCILRLAPENRAAGLKAIKQKKSEWVEAIRYALHADDCSIGPTAAYWVAAARARAPWSDDALVRKKHGQLGPDAADAAKLLFQWKTRKSGSFVFHDLNVAVQPKTEKSPDPLLVTVVMHASRSLGRSWTFEMGGFGGRTVGAVRWTSTIWPQARESFFASSADICFPNLDWWEAQWQNRTMLEPMIDAGTPLRTAGLIFLCGMLAAKEPGESGLATDIAIRAIEDGRLGSDNLGEGLATLLAAEIIKPGRWHKTLSEIARASALHAGVIRLALERCFVKSKTGLPKDSSKLLELLYELSVELSWPIGSEDCRHWLASGEASGKSAKLAKALLAISETAESKESLHSVLEQAIAQRAIAAQLSQ